MSSLVRDRSGNYLVAFRYAGKQHTKSLMTRDARRAEAGRQRVETTLAGLKQGWVTIPEDADPGEFIISGGTRATKPVAPPHDEETRLVTLQGIFDAYTVSIPPGAKESNTLLTERIHQNHFRRLLGDSKSLEEITLAEIQQYVARRSREHWRGRSISGDTIRKELKTLRYVWTWAHGLGRVSTGCPWQLKEMHFSKDQGREPFRTYADVERIIGRGGLDEAAQKRLWECLYLTGTEVEEVLEYVRDHAPAQWVYPLIAFAALTGARRSEILRSRIDDWDFDSRIVHVRELKRDKSKQFTVRAVDIHPRLGEIVQNWLGGHPGGQRLICQDDRSEVSKDLASHHFKRTLAGHEKWCRIRGFHTFRHSFASILASTGQDQRVIDALMGHQTEEMRKRYQHLFPKAKRSAVDSLIP